MKYTYFEITNFKGVQHVKLDFEARPRSHVYTLVGLNESGKTTILEAMDFLSVRSEELKALGSPGHSKKDPRDLIPMGQRDNFNGAIEIEAGFEFEKEDITKLRQFLESDLNCELISDLTTFTVSKKFTFKNSTLEPSSTSNFWALWPEVKRFKIGKLKKRIYAKKVETIRAYGPSREEWLKIVEFLKTLTPAVVYFPNFLFDFPNKIYLEESSTFSTDEQDKHRTYRSILQDVLDAMGGGMTLGTHVLERAKSTNRHDRQALEAVTLKMEGHITRTVFDNWNRIFARQVGNKNIVVRCEEDSTGWYLQLRLKDGTNVFEISERSLGFRWFFAFMLLTQYRGFRKDAPGNMLFLLDEPASNLHPSAQNQLLKSFENMPNCAIVYTTHSHHLINPAWLESTFVVKNAGLDYDSDQDYSASDTNVTIERYRTFVDKYPQQKPYFQSLSSWGAMSQTGNYATLCEARLPQ